MLHAVSQISSLLRSSRSLVLFSARLYITVSSANSLTSELMSASMSFMYTKKRIGPTTDLCGTPDVTVLAVDG